MKSRTAVFIILSACLALALAVAAKTTAQTAAKAKKEEPAKDVELTSPIGKGASDEKAYAGYLHEKQIGIMKRAPDMSEEIEEDLGGKLGHDIAASIYGEYEPEEEQGAAAEGAGTASLAETEKKAEEEVKLFQDEEQKTGGTE